MAQGQTGTWVQTDQGKLDCKKIVLYSKVAKLQMENGEKKSIPIDQITSYSDNGKVFNKMPFYERGIITKKVFMELLKTRDDGLSLYKYLNPNGDVDEFIYKGEILHMYVDLSTREKINKEFGL
jgi:hypothetical protein